MKKKSNRLTVGEISTYSLGALGKEVSNNCINTFFLVYLCVYMHLNPLYMSIAFVLAKVWDAVNDPMLAALVNNSKKTKIGRYRPFILLGSILNGVVIVFMFYPLHTSAEGLRYLYYIVLYVLWGMSYTVLDVPFWAMLPTVANTTDERNKISSFVKLVGVSGGYTINTIGTSFVLPKFAAYGMEKAYFILGIIASVVMVLFVSVMVIGNSEKYEIPHNQVSLSYILGLFKKNDQLRSYAITFVLYNIGYFIAFNQILYLFVYCYENGADFLASNYSFTLFWIIACTGQGLAMIFYTWITRKIPREKLYGASYLFMTVSMVLLFLVFFFLKPGKEYHLLNSVLVSLAGSLMMLAAGIMQIGSTVMIADVVDYGEWKYGERGDTVIFSVQTLLMKFAGAVSSMILGIGISVAGLPNVREYFNENVGKTVQVFVDNAGNQIDAAAMINGNSLTVLRVFMFLTPIPLLIAGYITYKKKYWLYGEKYDNIKAEIDARRKEANSDGERNG